MNKNLKCEHCDYLVDDKDIKAQLEHMRVKHNARDDNEARLMANNYFFYAKEYKEVAK